MGRPCVGALLACAAIAASCCCCFRFQGADAAATPSFGDNFDITGAEDHVKTSPDGQTWYLSLDNKTGVGFQTKQKYLFGWFSMKLKLVGNDSAGVVTAYYVFRGQGAHQGVPQLGQAQQVLPDHEAHVRLLTVIVALLAGLGCFEVISNDFHIFSASEISHYPKVARNLVIYDYCDDRKRFPAVPEECALRTKTS
ncbi:putative xyloglucan endotransglucosylase/hydrolase protein 8 [Triticum urartu]|uniref:xyloglucan:xyloglucosyl transferase n=1 Tax=Triticum urartu TaxID=4572 RepID=M7ZAH4_TRIUA|nr:putative xyloglucan endotransglucosylase/hydrolase protein 8 [Triticum urartu]